MTVNKILTNKDRKNLEPIIQEMWRICPEMMSRKIADANVQQAFVLDQVLKILKTLDTPANILSVGCFEDTAYEYLINTAIKNNIGNLVGIDPVINFDLRRYASSLNNESKFDIIFSTSTVEHVKDDETFLNDICSLLKPHGNGILTTDFKNDYKVGDPLPYSDERFYTEKDFVERFIPILEKNNCKLVDTPDWSDMDNFIYQGHVYSFATFVFRKN